LAANAPNAPIAVGVLVINQVTYTLATMTDGNLLFGSGATVTANAPAATIDGQAISFGVSGLVVDGSSTFPVSAAAPSGAGAAAVSSGGGQSDAPTTGNQGQALATPPPDSSFQQFNNASGPGVASVGTAGGKGGGSAKAGTSDGKLAAGVESAAVGRQSGGVLGASAFGLIVGVFVMLTT
jgi:hypothetical protein